MKKEHLLLKAPTVKEIYLGKHGNQTANYLLLPDNYNQNLLEHDVKAGAKLYAPCLGNDNLFRSKYTIITASNLEDGYRAVTYLAAKLANDNGYVDPPTEYSAESDDEIYLEDLDDLDDEENTYCEDFSRIPIIPMSEIENFTNRRNDNPGFGAFHMEYNRPFHPSTPWWMECQSESVCIVQERPSFGSFGGTFFNEFGDNELLSQTALSGLRRFSGNEHVYVLIVANQIPEDDYTISRSMLELSGEVVNLITTEEESKAYHHTLMKEMLYQYGLKLSSKVDSPLLAEKLSGIDKRMPCHTYEQVMKYIVARNFGPTIGPETFTNLGLNKLIDKYSGNNKAETSFSSLFGMKSVKNEFNRFLDSLRYNKMREKAGLEPLTYHKTMLFVGAPGTAKTTAAKLLTDIMAKENLLPGDRFISISGAQLKGAYVGQTAPKIHALFRDYDSIFIDEAYSLTSNEHGEIDMYAQEALAQLAVELEAHSTDKLIIFAGYGGKKVSKNQNKMKQFIDANPGIKSRISNTVYFDSYSPAEMYDILKHLATQAHLDIDDSCQALIEKYFCDRSKSRDFGNGREARSFLEECQRNLASRLLKENSADKTTLSVITKEDIHSSIEHIREMNAEQEGFRGSLGYSIS